jgi:hypothetical protein
VYFRFAGAILFRRCQQFAVFEFVPAMLKRSANCVPFKIGGGLAPALPDRKEPASMTLGPVLNRGAGGEFDHALNLFPLRLHRDAE